MDPRVAVENYARSEDPPGIRHVLQAAHQFGGFRAPLAFNERGHVQAGAVLRLQRSVVLLDDQLDELVHERVVTVEVGGLPEVRR